MSKEGNWWDCYEQEEEDDVNPKLNPVFSPVR